MHNTTFIQTSNRLRTKVNHALCLHDFEWAGSNTLPMNRLFFLFRSRGGYIRHHDHGRIVKELELKTNHIYFMPKNAELSFRFEKGTGVVAFHFALEAFGGFDLLDGIKDCRMTKATAADIAPIRHIMENTESPRDAVMLQALLLQHCCAFMDEDKSALPHQIGLGERYRSLFEQIETSPNAGLTIGELAQAAGLSRDALSKSFRKDFGIPLKTFLQRRLVDHASEMLLYTDMRIGEIALKLNFNDEYYFSRFFKKHTGSSPSVFRKKTTI